MHDDELENEQLNAPVHPRYQDWTPPDDQTVEEVMARLGWTLEVWIDGQRVQRQRLDTMPEYCASSWRRGSEIICGPGALAPMRWQDPAEYHSNLVDCRRYDTLVEAVVYLGR
jgi:hypothetical protein